MTRRLSRSEARRMLEEEQREAEEISELSFAPDQLIEVLGESESLDGVPDEEVSDRDAGYFCPCHNHRMGVDYPLITAEMADAEARVELELENEKLRNELEVTKRRGTLLAQGRPLS